MRQPKVGVKRVTVYKEDGRIKPVASEKSRQSYTRGEVCRLLGLNESVLTEWEVRGFVAPQSAYGFRDFVALKALRELRKKRFRPDRIRLVLDSLRDKLSHIRDPLAELKIISDGRQLAVIVDGRKMEALSGQLLLDFDKAEITRLLEFPSRQGEREELKRREAAKWFDRGLELEQSAAPASDVIEAYQRSLEFDPRHAGACVNLGTVYFHLKKWADAEKYYLASVAASPEYALAHFNLGNLYDERGFWEKALEHYLVALRIQPDYADAHYNVALVYQGHGETLKAVRHWRAYLKLDPTGYWAGIARRELAKVREMTVLEGAGA